VADLWLGKAAGDGTRVSLSTGSLTTHAVCVGMTGSGKTGLCVGLLEEVANAGVPIIAIDPKGDLTNLALTEPDAAVAAVWRAGQASWGIAPDEVRRWAANVDVHLWTPGSDAGLGVNVLASLRRPAGELDDEVRRELVIGSVSALLGLVGEPADPVRSPAHIVLSRILEEAWARGDDPDLEALLGALVDPPFGKVGVFPTDKFFPPDDRLALAMRLNALLASPAFAAWSTGATLDIPALLTKTDGRVPVHVFTLAHLSEPERHFFVGILLDRISAWTRGLGGSSELRALVFFDEIWGFLPPHPKDPPAKRPLLALLKQARSVGVGTVLATQNPVDLDYKALSNAGTWFVGRLQTKNDRDRVADGLTGAGMERKDAEALLDQAAPRRFVLQQAGKGPRVFDTRWTRVWLAGPLTRPQIRALSKRSVRGGPPEPQSGPPPVPPRGAPPADPSAGGPPLRGRAPTTPNHGSRAPLWSGSSWTLDPRAVFAARMDSAFTPFAEPHTTGTRLRPALLVQLRLRFDEERAGYVDEQEESRVFFPLEDALPMAPLVLPLQEADLVDTPLADGLYDPLPDWMDEPKELEKLVKDVVARVVAEESRGMWANPTLKLHGRPGESRADFDARCAAAVEARVDDEVGTLRATYEKKVDTLEDRIRRLDERRAQEATAHAGKQAEEWMNVGETVLSFFTGRKKSLTAVATRRRQVVAAGQRVESADAELAEAREAVYALEQELEDKIAALCEREGRALGATVEREIRLERDDVRVLRSGLLWVPVSRRV
jgi:hypothetical protein